MQVETCWTRAIESAAGLEQRYAAAAAFNEKSRFRKRGIAVTPTKFGISFTTKFLNQVMLLVNYVCRQSACMICSLGGPMTLRRTGMIQEGEGVEIAGKPP